MSSVKVGVNGLGRIGRYFLRLCSDSNSSIQVKAVNSPGSIEASAHLLKYDSVHGIFDQAVTCSSSHIQVGDQKILYSRHKNPEEIQWEDVDVILECTGLFKEKEDLKRFFKNQVKKVIVAAPAKGADWTVVYGVNHKDYDPSSHHTISNASCTTNGLAPLAQVLDENFGIEQGFLTTVHAYTNDQKLLDSAHKDLRRARAANLSMIPTTTGATSAIEKILPALKGKLQGVSIRIPTSNVSLIEFVVQCKSKLSVDQVHRALNESSKNDLKGILQIETKPLVSCDFLGSKYSAIVDTSLTKVHRNQLQIFAWYDNEAGFCHRLIDVINLIHHQGF